MPTMFMDKLSLDRLPLDKLGLDKLGLDRRKEELEEALIGSTTLLAVVGAGDLAVERLRAARAELAARSSTFDPATFREQAQATLVDRLEALQNGLMATPDQITQLPERAQEWPMRAQSMLADLVSAAFSTYGELAGRGKSVVTQSPMFADDGLADGAAPPAYDEDLPVTRPGTPVIKPVTRTVPVAEVPVTRPAAKVKAAKTSAAKTSAAKTSAAKTSAAKTSAAKTSAAKAGTKAVAAGTPGLARTAAKKTAPTQAPGTTMPKPDAGPTDTSR